MKISIVTATYNRSKLLTRLYQSILENSKTFSNIEWRIMDDGSQEDISSLVSKWQKEADFPIFFYHQENKGKMSAINSLILKVEGDIIIEMDDDDYFVSHCFQMISDDFEKIKEEEEIYGVIYEKDLSKGRGKIEDRLNQKVMRLYDLHYKEKKDFDMALTFKADYRKKFIYPLESGEKFVTEARMYYKMDQGKKGFLIHNEKIMICEYQEEGYSKSIEKLFKNNPCGYYAFFQEIFSYPQKNILFSKRLYNIKHYILFGYLCGKSFSEMKKYPTGLNKFLFCLLYLPGILKSKKKFGDRNEKNSN